ncbi:MAG: hypothetical protein HYT80_04425 [Euryarchaeota archaeon]|nr:hypothetical protein [Euryarchaeota archaeon]
MAYRSFTLYDFVIMASAVGTFAGMYLPWVTGRVCVLGCRAPATFDGWSQAGPAGGVWFILLPAFAFLRRERLRRAIALTGFLVSALLARVLGGNEFLFRIDAVHWGVTWTAAFLALGVAASLLGLWRAPSAWDPPMNQPWWHL